ncbi:hypothetical protein Tco_0620492 [Tanacetum coccineum]
MAEQDIPPPTITAMKIPNHSEGRKKILHQQLEKLSPIPSPPHPSPPPHSPHQSPPHSPHQSPLHSPSQSPPHSPLQSPPYSPPHSSPPRVTSLEKELKDTKQTLGDAVLKLVKKVKSLEKVLKRKSKKVIVSASEGEEPEDQGG